MKHELQELRKEISELKLLITMMSSQTRTVYVDRVVYVDRPYTQPITYPYNPPYIATCGGGLSNP